MATVDADDYGEDYDGDGGEDDSVMVVTVLLVMMVVVMAMIGERWLMVMDLQKVKLSDPKNLNLIDYLIKPAQRICKVQNDHTSHHKTSPPSSPSRLILIILYFFFAVPTTVSGNDHRHHDHRHHDDIEFFFRC